MKLRATLFAIGAVLAMSLAAMPVSAHKTYTVIYTLSGTVTGKHTLNGIDELRDEVTFQAQRITVLDCAGGPAISDVTTIDYSGAFIQGHNGDYEHLGQYWHGHAGASTIYTLGTGQVHFGVGGTNMLGLRHYFYGWGFGVATSNNGWEQCSSGDSNGGRQTDLDFAFKSDVDVPVNATVPPFWITLQPPKFPARDTIQSS